MIVLLFQSLTGSTQVNSTQVDSTILTAWSGPNGSICMTADRAAQLINAEDSLSHLIKLNEMLDDLLFDTKLIVDMSNEQIHNLLETI